MKRKWVRLMMSKDDAPKVRQYILTQCDPCDEEEISAGTVFQFHIPGDLVIEDIVPAGILKNLAWYAITEKEA